MSSEQTQRDEQNGPDLSQPQADVNHASAPQKESVMSSEQPRSDEQIGPDLSQPQADVKHASAPQKESVVSSEQPQSDEQNGTDLSRPQADVNHASSPHKELDRGTDVMGEPVNPLSESGHATATSHAPTSPASAGSFPTAQRPATLSTPSNESGGSQQPTEQSGVSRQPPAQSGASTSPYVQTSSDSGATGKTPMDSIMQVFNKWGKMAEDMSGNIWTHLRTGPNMADTALGRIAVGTKAVTGGGIEKVYRQTFDVAPDEHLLKTYACYLSTSTGPVAGTLYISTRKLAFCSDRPLSIPAPQQQAGTDNNTNQPEHIPTSSPSKAAASSPSKKSSATQQQQQRCYFKVMVPISQVESVNPSENSEKKPPEKYVQVKTTDGHDFWFMGFVNYDKGVKNLQEAVHSKAISPTTNTASDATSPASNTEAKSTNPTTNTDSHVAT